MSIRVGINGFGRIGRSFYKVAHTRDDIEVVAINDLGDPENLAYLLKYDTAQTSPLKEVNIEEDGDAKSLVSDGRRAKFFSIRDPKEIPWGDYDVDVVVESTGIFRTYEKSKQHLDAGAKRVVVSAPIKGEEVEGISGGTVLMGINEEDFAGKQITSNASCTTNSGSPLVAILNESIGIEKALLNTVHAYTASQSLVDGPNKDWRKGRAAAQNIIPTTTGAAIATTKVIPDLEGKFDGIALRVPVIAGSVADITFISKRDTSKEEVNEILMNASQEPRWMKTFGATYEPIVSSDIVGSEKASIADLTFTRVVGGNLVKVLAWYDNEMGYTYSLVEHVVKAGQFLDN
ncbi:MAG: type I glyceraldehyde-3-phosphate dehydrogenase [Candidatus Campbellbacteria bacterium]|nr:type I glyceraldehyde-3-phosphate dehydrogenase [Candidatus Campbellbacteria bacterium]